MDQHYRTFWIRDWQPRDRALASAVIQSVLTEYGLTCEPQGADQDVWEVERCYHQTGGEFWVVEQAGELVGTAAYYPVTASQPTVEIRKMYLRADVRGQGLGRWLLTQLEAAIQAKGYQHIRIETASVLTEAVGLYERSGYVPDDQVETARCDRAYTKQLQPTARDRSAVEL